MHKETNHKKFNTWTSYVAAGIMGLAVGDAMGVPVEFHKREE